MIVVHNAPDVLATLKRVLPPDVHAALGARNWHLFLLDPAEIDGVTFARSVCGPVSSLIVHSTEDRARRWVKEFSLIHEAAHVWRQHNPQTPGERAAYEAEANLLAWAWIHNARIAGRTHTEVIS